MGWVGMARALLGPMFGATAAAAGANSRGGGNVFSHLVASQLPKGRKAVSRSTYARKQAGDAGQRTVTVREIHAATWRRMAFSGETACTVYRCAYCTKNRTRHKKRAHTIGMICMVRRWIVRRAMLDSWGLVVGWLITLSLRVFLFYPRRRACKSKEAAQPSTASHAVRQTTGSRIG